MEVDFIILGTDVRLETVAPFSFIYWANCEKHTQL